jgi:hypothetical protein
MQLSLHKKYNLRFIYLLEAWHGCLDEEVVFKIARPTPTSKYKSIAHLKLSTSTTGCQKMGQMGTAKSPMQQPKIQRKSLDFFAL